MKRRAFLRSSVCSPLGLLIPKTAFSNGQYEWAPRKPTIGPLKPHPQNPRYFTDGNGKAIYLTGSHMGWELQDDSWGRKHKFDFSGFLDFLVKHNHNLMRMWIVEHTRWDKSNPEAVANPMPYLRTGPDQALDGGLKYNLKRFNPEYFKRLRSRVKAAGEKGIYVLIMLFQGFSLHIRSNRNPWFGHPFNELNNINGVNGDMNHDGDGREFHSLSDPQITVLQERYVCKVIDTVNDLDNVLFEIGNECGAYATQWQYHMIRYIKEYESSKPKQHPVGMTAQIFGGKNAELFESPADWISPNREGGYRDNPPAANGTKVIISDTDHHGAKPYPERRVWVWKSFLRGHNPIFLDMYPEQETKQIDEIVNSTLDPRWEPIRYMRWE